MDAGRNDPAERPDDDNPKLTQAEVRRARPAGDVLRELVGEAAAAITKRRPGRPVKQDKAVVRSFRLPPDVSAAYEATGPGWRKLVAQTLRDHMPGRK